MENKDLRSLTNEELLKEKKKLKQSKIMHALIIGIFAGVLVFGFTGWILSPNRRIGFFIPMLIPIAFIYKMLKSPNKNKDLENVLKERGLY